jgi:hypothetical protein
MHFMKPSSTTLVIVKGREGDVDMVNQACLRSDLVKEWDDVGAIHGRRYRGTNVRELKVVGYVPSY